MSKSGTSVKSFPHSFVRHAIEGATKGGKQKLTLLLDAIGKYDWKQVPFYADITRLSPKSIERYIKQLRDAGFVDFDGDASQTGGYHIMGVKETFGGYYPHSL